MPRFYVEFGSATQRVIEAADAASALREFLDNHRYCLDTHLVDYNDSNDPECVYHGHDPKPWQHVTISISPPLWKCANPKCSDSVEKAGAFCGHCTFECEECCKELDLSERSWDEDCEGICKTCAAPLMQLARTVDEES